MEEEGPRGTGDADLKVGARGFPSESNFRLHASLGFTRSG